MILALCIVGYLAVAAGTFFFGTRFFDLGEERRTYTYTFYEDGFSPAGLVGVSLLAGAFWPAWWALFLLWAGANLGYDVLEAVVDTRPDLKAKRQEEERKEMERKTREAERIIYGRR